MAVRGGPWRCPWVTALVEFDKEWFGVSITTILWVSELPSHQKKKKDIFWKNVHVE